MALNRDTVLKRAEKLLRDGKLKDAITEYVRLIEDQPRDWNSINTLGDLYARAGDTNRAVELFVSVADHLYADGVIPKANALYKKALKLKANSEPLLLRMAVIAARQRRAADAEAFFQQLVDLRRGRGEPLTVESAGNDPEILLLLARHEMRVGHDAESRRTLTRLLTVAPEQRPAVLGIARDLAAADDIDRAQGCLDVLTDAAILAGQWDDAIEALKWFTSVRPDIATVTKLVDVCADAGRTDALNDAKALLHDIRVLAGEELPAEVAEPAAAADGAAGLSEGPLEPEPVVTVEAQGEEVNAASDVEQIPVLETVEIDLSGTLAHLGAISRAGSPLPPEIGGEAGSPGPGSALADVPAPADGEHEAGDAPLQLERGIKLLDEGDPAAALEELEAAARAPSLRFKAGVALGRLHIGRGDVQAGIEWLERASEALPPSPEEGHDLLYELADVLELLGESARALAVLLELEAGAGGYRDVRSRIDRLTRVQAGGNGA